MKEYAFYWKKITPLQMLWIVFKSWFLLPPSTISCLILIFLLPFYLSAILAQILLFLPALPVLVLAYLPLALKLYSKPEKNWFFWMVSYAVCAALISGALTIFFYDKGEVLIILGAFTILSGLCGTCIYFNLYNKSNMEIRDDNSTPK